MSHVYTMAHLSSGVCFALNEPGPVFLTAQVPNEFKASLRLTIELPTVVKAAFHHVVLIGSHSMIRILGDIDLIGNGNSLI